MDAAAALARVSLWDHPEHLTTVLWVLVLLWLFWFGGSVGSFMNVVVYRLPAGLNLVHPGSRCPNCLHAIRWYHNLPMLGWLILRGRCRDCRAPISARYPLVEALVAGLFVSLAAALVLTEGGNLPPLVKRAEATATGGAQTPRTPQVRRPAGSRHRLRHPIADTPERLWGMYAFQLVMCCTLLCAALIAYDGKRVTWQLFFPAILIGLIAPLFWPELRPVPLEPEYTAAPWERGLAEGSAGIVVGGLLGVVSLVASSLVRRGRLALSGRSNGDGPEGSPYSGEWPRWAERVFPLALCGLFLGWQAGAGIAALAALLWAGTSSAAILNAALRRWNWPLAVTLAALAFMYAWGPITSLVPLFGPSAGMLSIANALATVVIASLAVSQLPQYTPSPPPRGEPTVKDPAENLQAILQSKTYLLAEADTDFLARPELRPVRMQLELLKPQMALEEQGVKSTIVVFGGTSIVERGEAERRLELARQDVAKMPGEPAAQRGLARAERVLAKATYYDQAREFARLVSASCQAGGICDYVVITGGGPGIMEAANRGAFDVGAKSIGLNITLPAEQAPNPYITPELCFQFHYFALRKMHFLLRAKALVVFPGGFGTLDELTDALTLRQTQRMQAIPIIMYGREYWRRVIDFQFLADEGVIADEHLKLIDYADTPKEAWKIIATYHDHA